MCALAALPMQRTAIVDCSCVHLSTAHRCFMYMHTGCTEISSACAATSALGEFKEQLPAAKYSLLLIIAHYCSHIKLVKGVAKPV
jgi:hypothetical protein